MKRLENALEKLDETISVLEEKVDAVTLSTADSKRKQAEVLRLSRAREAGVMAVAQKVASRLDHTISHVEQILK